MNAGNWSPIILTLVTFIPLGGSVAAAVIAPA